MIFNKFISVSLLIFLSGITVVKAQFLIEDKIENLRDFDEQKFNYGFYLIGNQMGYKLVHHPEHGMEGIFSATQPESGIGFGAGLMGKIKINNYIDLRIEPNLQFSQRKLIFNKAKILSIAFPLNHENLTKRIIKSTYLDIPLFFELHGERWFNSRPYIAGGINWLVNLQSNENSLDDNRGSVFRSTTHNFGWSAEMGVQFYFRKFKLSPAIRGIFVLNNESLPDFPKTEPYWATSLVSAKSRIFMFVLKFE